MIGGVEQPRASQVRAAARDILDGFESFTAERAVITRRARARFEWRDWAGGQRDARLRLDLRDRRLHETVGVCRAELAGAARDRELWRALRERYDGEVDSRPDAEIARSFFNSVSRRVLGTVGVAEGIEFLEGPRPGLGAPPLRRFARERTTEALLRRVLEAYAFAAPYQDLARDVRVAAIELEAHLRELPDAQPMDAIELAEPVFFRGKGAYLVGRLRRGRHVTPLCLALVHEEGGVVLDAVLFTEDDLCIVFSFTRSYFHVDRPPRRPGRVPGRAHAAQALARAVHRASATTSTARPSCTARSSVTWSRAADALRAGAGRPRAWSCRCSRSRGWTWCSR